jgi:hypothetical protein
MLSKKPVETQNILEGYLDALSASLSSKPLTYRSTAIKKKPEVPKFNFSTINKNSSRSLSKSSIGSKKGSKKSKKSDQKMSKRSGRNNEKEKIESSKISRFDSASSEYSKYKEYSVNLVHSQTQRSQKRDYFDDPITPNYEVFKPQNSYRLAPVRPEQFRAISKYKSKDIEGHKLIKCDGDFKRHTQTKHTNEQHSNNKMLLDLSLISNVSNQSYQHSTVESSLNVTNLHVNLNS